MNQLRAVRPLVFTITLPRGVALDDLAEALVTKRRYEDFERVSHYGFGRYEIKAKTEKIAQDLAKEPTVLVKGTEYKLNYLGYRTTKVSVFYYPVDEHISYLESALAQYGKVAKIEEAKYKKHKQWGSGVFQAFMEMEKRVPNYLKVNAGNRSFVVQCEYQGVTRVCRKCGREGHLNSNCNTPKCTRCGVFGHESCTDPCPRCQADHPVNECRQRTFAAALGYSKGLVPALDVIPDINDIELETAVPPATSKKSSNENTDKEQEAIAQIRNDHNGKEDAISDKPRSEENEPHDYQLTVKPHHHNVATVSPLIPIDRKQPAIVVPLDAQDTDGTLGDPRKGPAEMQREIELKPVSFAFDEELTRASGSEGKNSDTPPTRIEREVESIKSITGEESESTWAEEPKPQRKRTRKKKKKAKKDRTLVGTTIACIENFQHMPELSSESSSESDEKSPAAKQIKKKTDEANETSAEESSDNTEQSQTKHEQRDENASGTDNDSNQSLTWDTSADTLVGDSDSENMEDII